jgi:hypothetical protein
MSLMLDLRRSESPLAPTVQFETNSIPDGVVKLSY